MPSAFDPASESRVPPPEPRTGSPRRPASADDEGAFRFHVPVPVRFRDIDVGAHAHHSHALAYFEEARWAYWTRVAGRPAAPEAVDYILAEAHLRYRDRILYPGTLSVGVRAASIGRKHVELAYEILVLPGAALPAGEGPADGGAESPRSSTVAVTGSTVLVMYDYGDGHTMSVPPELRARLEAFEGRTLPRHRSR